MEYVITNVNNAYVSCGCNLTLHAADWGHNGLICYGACNAVVIYDYKAGHGGKVLATLAGHQRRVNAVKWARKKAQALENEFVSVSTDQCGLVWTKKDDTFVVSAILKGHEGPVTVVDAVYRCQSSDSSELVIVTASADSTIRLWERKGQEEVECTHVLQLDSCLCISACLAVLPCGSILLAAGLDDSNIRLYSKNSHGGNLAKQRILRGHEDWVTALQFTLEDNEDLLLASGSQDATVRLWRFHPVDSKGEQLKDQLITVEQQLISVGATQLAVGLESVLLGHDGRVYGICWHPPVLSESGQSQPLQLLTASLDKTVVVWAPEAGGGGVWLERARMGEVGGNTLGFYGACYGPVGASILAHSYTGGFHVWHKCQEGWRPGVAVGGHYDAVSDLAWEPLLGRYVLTVSGDQTTRLHAPWVPFADLPPQEITWHEIARPQIHGYDMVCLAMLPHFRFVSGADEKVVRAFTATQNFLENFKTLCLSHSQSNEEEIGDEVSLPTGAAVPVLGLSNKAVFQSEVEPSPAERHVKDQYDENSYFTPQHLTEPPTEDTLLQNTLWPETMKLYGHGYEIFSLAATSDGKLVASACKATNEEHAAILLWDTTSWQKVGRLVSHQLTVTQLQFSPDDRYLLSVSRDRRWSVFQRTGSELERYKLAGRSDKSTGVHARIIWCCSWSHDSTHFATGSRDGKVVVWGVQGENHPSLGPFAPTPDNLDLPKESFTSLAFAPGWVLSEREHLLAVGTEAGDIRLYGWKASVSSPWRFLFQLSGNFGHQLCVKRLAFRPVKGCAGQPNNKSADSILQLASCSLDHTLKIFNINGRKQGFLEVIPQKFPTGLYSNWTLFNHPDYNTFIYKLDNTFFSNECKLK